MDANGRLRQGKTATKSKNTEIEDTYFPHPELNSIFKKLDEAVRTKANITEYKQLGKDFVEVYHNVLSFVTGFCHGRGRGF